MKKTILLTITLFISGFTGLVHSQDIEEEIKAHARLEYPYPNDYVMQEYVYKRQAASKNFMGGSDVDKEIMKIAVQEYPNDFTMQHCDLFLL